MKRRGLEVTYISMQGGRKSEKWIEIRKRLGEEDIQVYATSESHLRDLEEPSVIGE